MFKKLKNKKGFTLIELVVVIAILAILAMLAIPRLTGFTNSAKEKTDDANKKMLYNVAAIVQAADEDLTVSGGGNITSGNFNETDMADYIDDWPVGQQDGVDFQIQVSGGTIEVLE